jgi:hypothetical protein
MKLALEGEGERGGGFGETAILVRHVFFVCQFRRNWLLRGKWKEEAVSAKPPYMPRGTCSLYASFAETGS